jgi:hypothetical protein
MANGHGGPRTPANPAPVSGPGALSKRTDGAQPKMQSPQRQVRGAVQLPAGPVCWTDGAGPRPGGHYSASQSGQCA